MECHNGFFYTLPPSKLSYLRFRIKKIKRPLTCSGLLMPNPNDTPSISLSQEIKTPRAAAAAGILFSILLAATMILLQLSGLPATPGKPEQTWNTPDVSLALHLVPFAGISFIWFMGVLRDRLGKAEDRFFSTVFWSSGVLFLATLFASAAVAGATTSVLLSSPGQPHDTALYKMGREISAQLLNIFSLRMAAVFMISTASLGLRTKIMPRWIALTGYVFALLLLVSSRFAGWLPLAFPCWIFIVSAYILADNFKSFGK